MADAPASYHAFISYRRGDAHLAERVERRLVAAGFTVWRDTARLRDGCDWHREIAAACEASRVVLPLLTSGWKDSDWCRYETYGHACVLPLLCEGEFRDVAPAPLRAYHHAELDFRDPDNEAAWSALVRLLHEECEKPAPETAPRTAHLPFGPNPHFVGRDKLLVELHEKLRADRTAALTQVPAQAVAGMGGVGKTTVAREYAEKFWRLYRNIFWVRADQPLVGEFVKVAEQLGLAPQPDEQPEQLAGRALAMLAEQIPRLLILDNAQDEEGVQAWIPKSGECRTLITSRFSGWSAQIGTLHVWVLEPEPARQLLLFRSGKPDTPDTRQEADALAKELGYLPLALEQAAAYVMEQQISFAEYLGYLKETGDRQDLLARRVLGGTDYPEPLARTWLTTVDRLGPAARALLALISFLAPDDIPRDLLTEAGDLLPAGAELPEPLSPRQVKEALGELRRYSLVTLGEERDAASIHRLVQTVQRDALPEDEHAAWVQRALQVVERGWPDGDGLRDYRNWPRCEQLLPHARIVAVITSDYSAHEWVRLTSDIAAYLLVRVRLSAAESMAQLAIELVELQLLNRPNYDSFRHALSVNLSTLGKVAMSQGDLASARRFFERDLEITQELRKRDPDRYAQGLAASFYQLGEVAEAQGDFASTRRFFEQLQNVAQELRGRDSDNAEYARSLSVSYGQLGNIALAQGNLASARCFFEQEHEIVLHLVERFPEDANRTRDLSVSFHRLGDVAVAQGDLANAHRFFEHHREIMQVLVERAPDSAQYVHELSVGYERLGDVAVARGDLPEARRFFERGQELRRHLCERAPDSAQYAHSLVVGFNCLGKVTVAQGDLPSARRFLEQGLEIAQELRKRAPDSAEYARDLSVGYCKLGDVALAQGDFASARRFCEQLREITQELLRRAPDSIEYARDLSVSYRLLGDVLMAQGDLANARHYFQRSHEMKLMLRQRAPDSAELARDLAVSHYKLWQWAVKSGDALRARRHRIRVLLTLQEMRVVGMHLDPPTAALLSELEAQEASFSNTQPPRTRLN